MAWLQFNDDKGITALDASGSGRAGLVVKQQPSTDAQTWQTGTLRLTPSQYLVVPLAWQPTRFTIAWRVNAASRGEWNQAVHAEIGPNSYWDGFLFHTASDGRVYVGTDTQTWLTLPAGTFEVNTWQQFVFTYDNGAAALYKNGVLLANRAGMTPPVRWERLTLGSANPVFLADAQYDELRVYERALSAAEVSQLQTSTASVYTPPSNPNENLEQNWSAVRSFDGHGNVVGESKQFTDALGRPTQAQVKNLTSGHVLATQTVYNYGGKGALQTLPAPINNREFSYQSGFITATGTAYDAAQFDGVPTPVPVDATTPGTLGYYYSANNVLEPLTATTSYPYAVSEQYAGPLGGLKRAASPGDELRLGKGREVRSRAFPLLNELDHYLSLRPQFTAGTPMTASLRRRGEKTVTITANGIEQLAFTDADGRTVATCLSGAHYPGLTLTAAIHADPTNPEGLPAFQDIHIPAAGTVPVTITGGGKVDVVDLGTDAVTTYTCPTTVSLAPGFYRVVSSSENQEIAYVAHYGDFSYSYYDDAGRVVATVAPKGLTVTNASAFPATGSVGQWSFNEGNGSTTADASGTNATGTLMNQARWDGQLTGTICAIGSEYQSLLLQGPSGTGITGIREAVYGSGQGADCSSFVHTPGCSADVKDALTYWLNQAPNPSSIPLAITNGNMGVDPCSGVTKVLRVQAAYASNVPASPAGGRYLLFDGQDDYVRVGDVPALRMGATMSLDAWIYPQSERSGVILSKDKEYELVRQADGTLYWAFNNTSPGWNRVSTGIVAPLNTWSRIGLSYDNGVVTAYLNGVQIGSAYAGTGSIAYTGGELWIGGHMSNAEFFRGAIDEVRIWNSVQVPAASPVPSVAAYVTRNTYNGAGNLVATDSPDEGRTEYVYAQDGRLRFSQSARQRQEGKFSYSNYDAIGRVVESGEYTMPTSAPQAIELGILEAESAQTNGQVETNVAGASNGQDVGSLNALGRKVEFQRSIPRAGSYVLRFRYASALAGARTMSLYVDGVDVQQVVLPTTGSWTSWETKQVLVSLAAGTHAIGLQMDEDDAGGISLDYLQTTDLTQGLVFENQLPTVTAYEAEYFQTNATPNPLTDHPGYRGTGYLGNIVPNTSTTLPIVNTFFEVTVTVPKAGRYPIHLRYAAGRDNSTRSLPIYVNWNYIKHAKFPATGSWDNWETQTIDLDLREGPNLIRFQHDGRPDEGYLHLDYLEVAEAKQPTGSSVLYLVDDRTPSGGLDVARCSQRNHVWYDEAQADQPAAGLTQDFVLGAVAKTSNGSTTTWYSYDEQGNLSWMVQQLPNMGTKRVDYTYDLTGNVLQVAYQPGQPDALYHHYEYDADQRLHAVYTSPDGQLTTRTLQAKYFYYLHGPLKRQEIGDRLQGLDYAYTVQGWLKSINHATKRFDPGADKPTTNGFYKDLFGLTLDYFGGDYTSRQLALAAPSIPLNQNDVRYDGSIRASSWQTAAAPTTVHATAYRYDVKGQLQQADYGQLVNRTFVPSPTSAFEEGNLSYDAHGNIQTLRRRDGAGMATDDFVYQYTANTNQLATVKNQAGAAVLSYDYDATGQLVRETEAGQGTRYLTYDVTGKVTGVYRDAAHQQPLVTFAYNDRGQRASKTAYGANAVVLRTTYYVTDAQGNVLSLYEQPTSGAITQTEVPLYGTGRVGTLTRLDDGSLEPRYELNDHLGNARVVFRKPTTTTYLATMEPIQASQEEQRFQNLPATRTLNAAYAYDGSYVSRIVGNTGASGPAITLDVAKGDTVTFSAWTVVPSANRPAPRSSLLPFAVASGIATSGAPVYVLDKTATQPRAGHWLGRLAAGLAITGWGRHAAAPTPGAGNRPAAVETTMLRYRVRDINGNLVSEQYVSVGSSDGYQQLMLGVRATVAGTVEMTLTSTIPDQVFFDHVEATHTTGMIVQEQHQYAFGSPIVGLNYVVGTKVYRHGYQGQFAEEDEETGWESFELRMYNSRIGRWMSYDPKGQFDSPYVGMANNPVSGVDVDGGWSGPNGAGWYNNGRYLGVANKGLGAMMKFGNQAARSIVDRLQNPEIKKYTFNVAGGRLDVKVSAYNVGTVKGAEITVKYKRESLKNIKLNWLQTINTTAPMYVNPSLDAPSGQTPFYYANDKDYAGNNMEAHRNVDGFDVDFEDKSTRPDPKEGTDWRGELSLVTNYPEAPTLLRQPIFTISWGWHVFNGKSILSNVQVVTSPSPYHLYRLHKPVPIKSVYYLK